MTKIRLRKNAVVDLGTVSWRTMDSDDLINAFETELKTLTTFRSFSYIMSEKREWRKSGDAFWKSEYVDFLFDCLDAIAPEGCYFGATEGDGSDYGFWNNEECDEEYC